MSRARFVEFMKVVSDDSALQDRLGSASSADAFADAAVSLGAARGFEFTVDDVHAAVAGFETDLAGLELSESDLTTVAGGIVSASGPRVVTPGMTVNCQVVETTDFGCGGIDTGGWTPPSTVVPTLCQSGR